MALKRRFAACFFWLVVVLWALGPALAQSGPNGGISGPNGGIGAPPISAATSLSTTGGGTTLTASQLLHMTIVVTGTLGSSATLTIPAAISGTWTFVNETTAAYTLTVTVSGSATSLVVPQGQTRQISSDGTNPNSPVAQASALSTPTTTTNGDVPAFGNTTGSSLNDSGYGIGTTGNSLCAMNANCAPSGVWTFGGATNIITGVGSLLRNELFDVDLKYEGTANSVGIDGWGYISNVGSGLALQRVTTAPPGYAHSLKITAPGSDPGAPAAGTYRNVGQAGEGAALEALGWNTASGQAAVLSFEVECSITGSFDAAIRNSSSTAAYVAQYSVPVANTWTPISITIPAPGAIDFTSLPNTYAYVVNLFDVGSGSNYQTPLLNSWQTGPYSGDSTQTSFIRSANATCNFGTARLLPANVNGGWAPRPYAIELLLANRYNAKTFLEGTAEAQNAGLAGALCQISGGSYMGWFFRTPGLAYISGKSYTATTYNPSATNASFRDVTASADVAITVDPASAIGESGVFIKSNSTVTAGDVVCGHVSITDGIQ